MSASASASQASSQTTNTGPTEVSNSFGADAIRDMIKASEMTSNSWPVFYRKLQLLTSSAVDQMPPHHIKIVRGTNGYTVSIHGSVYNYDYQGSKVF